MPARTKKIRHDENTRAKIQAGNIIHQLHLFLTDQRDMKPHQVTAALGLLKKVLPDMQAQQIEANVTEQKSYVVEAPKMQTVDEWEAEYSPRGTLN